MNVRDALRELHRLGVADYVIGIQDETGDRYGRADWVKDLPVARIVIIPDVYATPTGPVDVSDAEPAREDDTHPYVGEFS